MVLEIVRAVFYGALPVAFFTFVINNGFIWLGASYLGYLAGLRLTAEKGDWLWEKTPGWYDGVLKRLRSRSSREDSDK